MMGALDSCWSWSCSGSDSGSGAELEVGIEPLALEGAVVVATQGGEEGGAAGELAGKRKRGDELAHQPVRHSLWDPGTRLTGGLQRGAVWLSRQRGGGIEAKES